MMTTMQSQTLRILLVSFFSLLWLSTPNFAAGGFAIVDARLLFVLHPKMAQFDYAVGRFYRDAAAQKDPQTIQKEMNLAWEKAQLVIRKLMSKQSSVIKCRYELMARHRKAVAALEPGKGKKEREVKAETQNGAAPENQKAKQTVDLDKKFIQDLAAVEQQLVRIQEELQNARENAYLPVYFTTKETEATVEEIRKEIVQFISQVAKENGLNAVLDTSFSAPATSLAKDICGIPTQPDIPDYLSSQLFHSFTNWNTSAYQKKIAADRVSHAVPRLIKSKMDSSFRQYFDYQPYLTQGLAQFSPGNVFVLGGNDLTPQVGRKIFELYKISLELKTGLLFVLTSHRRMGPVGTIPKEISNDLPPSGVSKK